MSWRAKLQGGPLPPAAPAPAATFVAPAVSVLPRDGDAPRALPPASVVAAQLPQQLPPAALPDANKLHAAAMRARMMGRTAEADALEAQAAALGAPSTVPRPASAQSGTMLPQTAPAAGLKRARPADDAAGAGAGAGASAGASAALTFLSPFDARGAPISALVAPAPALVPADLRAGSRAGRTVPKADLFVGGARTSFFPSEAASVPSSIGAAGSEAIAAASEKSADAMRALREAEWRVGAGDLDATLARNIVRDARAMRVGGDGSGAGEAAVDGDDAALGLLRARGDSLTAAEAAKRERARAIGVQRSESRAADACTLCVGGAGFARHAVVSIGEHALLALPPGGARIPGELVISPVAHVAAMTAADEAAYAEVNRFRAALHAAFSAVGQEPIFIETALRLGGGGGASSLSSQRPHARVHVVPMPKEVAVDAPLFFQQALRDSEEWTTHATVIDTKGKGLCGAIPPGFSYLHVSWAGGGFVHPIENDAEWPLALGLDVAAGMLGRGPSRLGRGEAKKLHTPVQEQTTVREFLKLWAPFDFTQQLD